MPDSFDDAMVRLRAGDQDAAADLFARYAGRLAALARARLGRRLSAKLDPEDAVQSALRTFFRRHAGGAWDLPGWDGLWALLAVLTARKCGRRVAYFRAARRDVGREAAAGGSGSVPGWDGIAAGPTPDEAAAAAELVDGLLRGLTDRDRRIVELSLEGRGPAEVGAAVGCTERTVQRVLARVRGKLEQDGPSGW